MSKKIALSDEQMVAIAIAVVAELTKLIKEYEVTEKIIHKGKVLADKGLDLIEAYYEATPTKVDNVLLGPICTGIRKTFNIPEDIK